MKDTIYSAIKATGRMHIGNYLGAVKNWVDLQNSGEFQTIYAVADLHSLTIDITPEELRSNTMAMAIDLLACGIDPEKSIFYIQSQVKEHSELAWIFDCVLPKTEMDKMTQFKDKAKEHKDNVNMGLFNYPALMAADILLYHGNVIPVGEDQDQHVELTRKVAKKFNNRWGEYFQEPKTKLTRMARLMALNDPTKKMSKDLGPKSYIAMSDSSDEIQNKIAKAVTGSGDKTKDIGGQNLLDLFRAFVADDAILEKFEEDFKKGELQYAKFKPMLANVIIQTLKPIQARRQELEKDPEYVADILEKGRIKAQEIAQKTMQEVRERVGLIDR